MANSNTSELSVTSQKAPTLALKFITTRFKNITLKQLETQYGLSHSTLDRIRKNKSVPNSHDHYMHVFVGIIDAKRRSAQITGNDKLVQLIDHKLIDLMLVQNGVPTAAERRLFEYKKKWESQK